VFLHVLVCTCGKECALSVLTVFNCCLCVLIMSEEDGVRVDEAAQGKLQGEVMSVLGKVGGNENCCSQKSLWCDWIVSSFII